MNVPLESGISSNRALYFNGIDCLEVSGLNLDNTAFTTEFWLLRYPSQPASCVLSTNGEDHINGFLELCFDDVFAYLNLNGDRVDLLSEWSYGIW